MRYASRKLSGWGRFPVEPCHLYRPEKRADLRAILASGAESSYVPRGLGRSYGDAALNLNAGAVSPVRLNRFLSLDSRSGVLECESGASFAEIVEFFLPRGFFLPVTPGTKFVTVGGAIAADIHGKNHHRDGSFGRFVERLRLRTAPSANASGIAPSSTGPAGGGWGAAVDMSTKISPRWICIA